MATKICSKCKVEKEYSEFGKNPDRKIGITSSCKLCINKKNRDYRARNRKQILANRNLCKLKESESWVRF
jgi:hypothetical protein